MVSPGSLSGVLELLLQEPGRWTPIAGGTELMVRYAAGVLRTRNLVNIFGLPELTTIEVGDERINLGAGCTYTAVRAHAAVSAELPLLARAASWTGSLANQNRGTLGGNLVNGSPAADTPPALLAYGARLELVSSSGSREVDYAEFHTGYKQTVLRPDELIRAVIVPRAFEGFHHYLRKVGPRNAQAISKVALGAVGRVRGGRMDGVRIGIASVAQVPWRCKETEAVLNGSMCDSETIACARAALLAEIAPLDDIRSTGRYRAQVAGNLLEEFLGQLGAAGQTGSCGSHGEQRNDAAGTRLERWNQLEGRQAVAELRACCGSTRWASTMCLGRPYRDTETWISEASRVWWGLEEKDWMEAFAAHPRIGEDKPANSQSSAWSREEQRTAKQSSGAVSASLKELNQEYERRFGFLYIVCAQGRTGAELLAVVQERLKHDRETEVQQAAKEQEQIMRLRMKRWLEL